MQQIRTVDNHQLVRLFTGIYLFEVETDSIGYTLESKMYYTYIFNDLEIFTSWQIEIDGGYLVLDQDVDYYLMRIGDFKKIDFKQIS